MLVYLLIGLINILAKTQNYGINPNTTRMDIRVRRDIHDISSKVHHIFTDSMRSYNPYLAREKRQTASRYNNNGRLDMNFVTMNNGMLKRNENNVTGNNWRDNYNWNNMRNQNNVNNGYNSYNGNVNNVSANYFNYNRFPGYKTNDTWRYPSQHTIPRYNTSRFHSGTLHPESEQKPVVYNHQDPTLSNFNGYYQETLNKITSYSPITQFNGKNASKPSVFTGHETTLTPVKSGVNRKHGVKRRMRTTTPRILGACAICNVPCPIGKHRNGWFCVDDQPDYDYY